MDSQQALQLRLAAATPTDTVLGMFFESSLAHVAQVQGAAVAEALRTEVLGKRSVVAFFRYPVADLLRLVNLSCSRDGGADYGAAVVEFGRAAARHFLGSPVGRTMGLLAGSDAHRLLSSSPSGYRAVTSFGERTYARSGEQSARMDFRGDLIGPGWQAGVIDQALQLVAGVAPRLDVEAQDAAALHFQVRVAWGPAAGPPLA